MEGVDNARRRDDSRRRVSSLPWDLDPPRTPRRPSAYTHYKKLVHDCERLDDELEQSRLETQQLETHLQRHADAVAAHAQTKRDQELAAWERERDRRVEAICIHSAAVQTLHKQQTELEDEEIRLQAELDVLRERQQLVNETDATRIHALVHTRSSLLDTELTKAEMDVAFLTRIVATNSRQHHKEEKPTEQETAVLHAVVDTVRHRRDVAFRDATVQFQQRLRSFEVEKEALQRKADEIQRNKQRALQVLSTNQQHVITDFFTTPHAASSDVDATMPSLEFAAILETMKQTTGETVGRLQDLAYGKATARRRLGDALAEATRNVENGPTRLKAIHHKMAERKCEALRLQIIPVERSQDWTIETYRPDQYELVYFLRSLVFEWMANAIERSCRQPTTQLLELEVRRFAATQRMRHARDEQAHRSRCSLEIAHAIQDDIVHDMAVSIYDEFMYSAQKVRGMLQQEIKDALFCPRALQQQQQPNQKSMATPEGTAPMRRWQMFGGAWGEIRSQRGPDVSPLRRLPRLLMRPAERAEMTPAKPMGKPQASVSPTKKRFGLFSGAAKTESKTVASVKTPELPSVGGDDPNASEDPRRIKLVTEIPEVTHHRQEPLQPAERMVWQHGVSSFASVSTCGLVTCLQLSSDAQFLAVGTLDGEVLVFSMRGEETVPPTVIRITPPSKATSARISRLVFSDCGRLVVSYNQLSVATLWTLARSPSMVIPASHSSDCFSMAMPKSKPPLLSMVQSLTPAELFAEPPVQPDVLERDAPVAAARLQAASAVAITSFQFFPSVSLLGEPTHLLCGASTGGILKLAIATTNVKTDPPRPRWLLGPYTKAAFNAPTPTDTELHSVSSSRRCDREFFRQGHGSAAVLFVGSIVSLTSGSSPDTDMRLVSVGQRGGVALWTYRRSSVSGFGWFVPHATYQLDLAFPDSAVGAILQIQLTRDRKTLVLMVFGKTPSGPFRRLRFVQLDVTTNELTVKPIRMELEMVGTIPPRFEFIEWQHQKPSTSRSRRPVPGRASFLVLLLDNTLHILSLHTGERCQPAISLHATELKHRNASTILLFNSITAASRPLPIVVLAGEQHRQIRVYRFHLSAAA